MCSHISDEMISRTLRAFSRAARRQERIEFGLSSSNVRNWTTFSLVVVPIRFWNSASSPVVTTSGHHCCPASPGMSRLRFRLTAMKRATFSARST